MITDNIIQLYILIYFIKLNNKIIMKSGYQRISLVQQISKKYNLYYSIICRYNNRLVYENYNWVHAISMNELNLSIKIIIYIY